MMLFVFQVAAYVVMLIALHELGHVASAKLLRIPIRKMGVTLFPVPHFFVSIKWPKARRDRLIYLFAGFAVYCCILFVCWCNHFFDSRALIIALGIQLIIETNPIYSDFVIAQLISRVYGKFRQRNNYKTAYREVMRNHLYSNRWYLHFFAWSLLVVAVLTTIRS